MSRSAAGVCIYIYIYVDIYIYIYIYMYIIGAQIRYPNPTLTHFLAAPTTSSGARCNKREKTHMELSRSTTNFALLHPATDDPNNRQQAGEAINETSQIDVQNQSILKLKISTYGIKHHIAIYGICTCKSYVCIYIYIYYIYMYFIS